MDSSQQEQIIVGVIDERVPPNNALTSKTEELPERYVYLTDKATFVRVMPDSFQGTNQPATQAAPKPADPA